MKKNQKYQNYDTETERKRQAIKEGIDRAADIIIDIAYSMLYDLLKLK